MRLLCVHADTVDALRRLRIPFDDLTPDGLWTSTFHLLAVSPEQRDVLLGWNVQFEELTPSMLERAQSGVREAARDLPRATTATPSRRGNAERGRAAASPRAVTELEVPVARRIDQQASEVVPGDEHAIVKEAIAARATPPAAPAPETPRARNGAANGIGRAEAPIADHPSSEGMRLRVSVQGKYREATIADGKILLDGKRYDTPEAATSGVTDGKESEWSFWEYFDAADGKWRMLDREWESFVQPSPERSGR